jgi:hypothetical protein
MCLPPRWGDDSLSSFLHQAFKNTLATFVRKHQSFELLLRRPRGRRVRRSQTGQELTLPFRVQIADKEIFTPLEPDTEEHP